MAIGIVIIVSIYLVFRFIFWIIEKFEDNE